MALEKTLEAWNMFARCKSEGADEHSLDVWAYSLHVLPSHCG